METSAPYHSRLFSTYFYFGRSIIVYLYILNSLADCVLHFYTFSTLYAAAEPKLPLELN